MRRNSRLTDRIIFHAPDLTIRERKTVSLAYTSESNTRGFRAEGISLKETIMRNIRDPLTSPATTLRLQAYLAREFQKPKKKERLTLIEKRAKKAREQLKKTTTRIKRLQTAKKNWQKKVNYYTRRGL